MVSDWWAMTTADLEHLSVQLLGPLPGGWVRRGDNFVRVGKVKFGSDPRKLSAEFAALSTVTKSIRATGDAESVLRAAAFFHLRFENIHPLCEGNGRIGRIILAGQLEHALRFRAEDTLVGLEDWTADYGRLFASNNPPIMFDLLVDLLGRITGILLSPSAGKLPASTEALYPQKHIPKNAPRLHPEKALANPSTVQTFARQQQKPSNGKAFRKFH